jgi:hypothetical protein
VKVAGKEKHASLQGSLFGLVVECFENKEKSSWFVPHPGQKTPGANVIKLFTAVSYDFSQ